MSAGPSKLCSQLLGLVREIMYTCIMYTYAVHMMYMYMVPFYTRLKSIDGFLQSIQRKVAWTRGTSGRRVWNSPVKALDQCPAPAAHRRRSILRRAVI